MSASLKKRGEIDLYNPENSDLPPSVIVSPAWIVRVDGDGRIAFREIEPLTLSPDPGRVLASAPADFPSKEYAKENVQSLRDALDKALLDRGLFT